MADRPLKRPPTSGTRKGTGAGWGGPAKGAGSAAPTIQTASPLTGGENPSGRPGYRALGKMAAHQQLKETIFNRALDPTEPLTGVVRAFEALSLRDLGAVPTATVNLRPEDLTADELTRLRDAISAAIGQAESGAGDGEQPSGADRPGESA